MKNLINSYIDWLSSLKDAKGWVKVLALLVLIALSVLLFSCSKVMYRSPTFSLEAEKAKIQYTDTLYFNPYYNGK